MGNKKVVIFIIILIFIIIGLGGYIAFDKFVLEKKEEIKTTKVGDATIDLNIFENINQTINTFDKAYNDLNSIYVGYLYSKNEININTFDKNAALYASIYPYLIANNTPQLIPGGLVKTKYDELFDKKLNYEAKSIEAGKLYKIGYDISTDVYSYNFLKIDNLYDSTYMQKNVETTVEDDNIIIKRKAFFVEYISEGDTVNKANIYKTHDKTELITSVNLKNNTINKKEIISKYGTKMNTYKYTFKQKSIDEYKFYSVEQVKK